MIKIQNIYYMLSYAFNTLNSDGYKTIAIEPFEHLSDLMAAILVRGISYQLKKGLVKAYIREERVITSPKGKIDISQSIKRQSLINKQVVCVYDIFSEDIYFNQILKTTILLLIRSKEVQHKQKVALKKVLLFFREVQEIDLKTIDWSLLRYHRNNAQYKMLMNICYLVIEGMLLTTEMGDRKLEKYFDDQKMSSLYEHFVRAYYQKHYPTLKAKASHIAWDVPEDTESALFEFLPVMKTDITLTNGEHTLIIDTKYYSKTMQNNPVYQKKSFHSHNMYQIYTYVKNKDKYQAGNVSGVLLYAKADEDITPNQDYKMGVNKISVKTLDLNTDFEQIKDQLDALVKVLI